VPANILVFGATSAIAHAIGRRYAAQGASLVLVGRDSARLEANAADLKVRGAAKAVPVTADLDDFARHKPLTERAAAELGRLDVVLIAHGTLPDQQRCENDIDELRRVVDTNFTSAVSLASLIAGQLERQHGGTLVVFGSVAGDRGKRSNYAYGAAKAGVAVFLDGLRIRLREHGVKVLTVKPGFVDTPMTSRFDKGLLWATPEQVAAAVCRAIDRGSAVIYVPWFWRPIMLVIRLLPSAIFDRMRI
jgi:decaprenylphospho-beta-D-erythro-pentofuranosid-2-ulose 2-reductase